MRRPADFKRPDGMVIGECITLIHRTVKISNAWLRSPKRAGGIDSDAGRFAAWMARAAAWVAEGETTP